MRIPGGDQMMIDLIDYPPVLQNRIAQTSVHNYNFTLEVQNKA